MTTQLTLYLLAVPAGKERAVYDVIVDNDLGVDYGMGRPPVGELLINSAYTDVEISAGTLDTWASALAETGATFLAWEEPDYEFLGDYFANTPELGLFAASCDANGSVVIEADELIKKVDEVDTIEELRAWVKDKTGARWQEALDELMKQPESSIKVPGITEHGDRETCEECHHTGFLLDQTYGCAEVPDGWTPVQRCDTCRFFDDDEDAAKAAAIAKGDVPVGYFSGGTDEDDGEILPGDWAIRWAEEG